MEFYGKAPAFRSPTNMALESKRNEALHDLEELEAVEELPRYEDALDASLVQGNTGVAGTKFCDRTNGNFHGALILI